MSSAAPPIRRATVAEIDLDALAHNVSLLRDRAAPAELWAVVKADGYGHGASSVARAALGAGAAGLCVALVQEGLELRAAGIDAPILLLSQQPADQLAQVVAADLTSTVDTVAGIEQLGAVARAANAVHPVHLKIDTGMQRVGAQPAVAVDLALRIAGCDSLTLAAAYTHLACADEPGHPATATQLARFDATLADLESAGIAVPRTHAANSAATLAVPAARRDLVRCGIAMYGISPGAGVDHLAGDLRPVMRLASRVSHVKRVEAGSHVSYGWRHRFARATTVATVPAGYADGVPRRLGTLPDRAGAEVLIGGRRRPIVGVVTMDQFMVDVGDLDVAVGDEVVLLGSAGDDAVTATEWAERLGTIGYEIVCDVSARVPRRAVGRTVGQVERAGRTGSVDP